MGRAVSKESNKIGIGCIAYNNEVQIFMRLARQRLGNSSLVAGILVIEEAIDLAQWYGWKKVGFMSDSKISIEAIKSTHVNHPGESYAPNLKNTREDLGFCFCPRSSLER